MLSRPWSHPVVLNTEPLDWVSSALTTRPLRKKKKKWTFIGDLRPKIYSCFYDIILMILWKKSLVQSAVCGALISSHKVRKCWTWHEWRHTRECTKQFNHRFPFIFFLILSKKNLFLVLWSFLPFLMNLWSCKVLNDQIVSQRKWHHPCKWT